MTELTDHELLAQYARNQSEAAFATLVGRYVNLVYSAALRFIGNPHHAQEVTQAVFIVLARKAGSLRSGTILSGWLYETARLTASNFLKSETRRQNREQEVYMQSSLTEDDSTAAWEQIAPLLEEAMGGLGESDRNAIVLRFFENKTAQEVAAKLRIKEGAAHKRVSRALEKLRKHFVKHGVTLTTAFIASAVAANSVQAAPVGLEGVISATAVKGAAVSASTLNLVKGALKLMAWTKVKMAIVLGAGLLVGGGAAATAVFEYSQGEWSTARQIAKKSEATYAALSSYRDTGKVEVEGGASTITTFSTLLQRPNLYRVESLHTGSDFTNRSITWSQGKGDFKVNWEVGQESLAAPENQRSLEEALISVLTGNSSTVIPTVFYRVNFGNPLGVFAGGHPAKRERDEKVNGVDCHVLSNAIDDTKIPGSRTGIKMTTSLWIGKRDHLIHKIRNILVGEIPQLPPQSDSDVKGILEYQHKSSTPEAIAAWRKRLADEYKEAEGKEMIFTTTLDTVEVDKKFLVSDFDR